MMWNSLTRAMADHMGALPFPFAEHRLPMFCYGFFGRLGLGAQGLFDQQPKTEKNEYNGPILCQGLVAQKKWQDNEFPPIFFKKTKN